MVKIHHLRLSMEMIESIGEIIRHRPSTRRHTMDSHRSLTVETTSPNGIFTMTIIRMAILRPPIPIQTVPMLANLEIQTTQAVRNTKVGKEKTGTIRGNFA